MTDNGGTTDTDYRWKWLATVWALWYGLGFPTAVMAIQMWSLSYPPGTLMGVLTLVWGGTVVYIIGPENIKAFEQLRGS